MTGPYLGHLARIKSVRLGFRGTVVIEPGAEGTLTQVTDGGMPITVTVPIIGTPHNPVWLDDADIVNTILNIMYGDPDHEYGEPGYNPTYEPYTTHSHMTVTMAAIAINQSNLVANREQTDLKFQWDNQNFVYFDLDNFIATRNFNPQPEATPPGEYGSPKIKYEAEASDPGVFYLQDGLYFVDSGQENMWANEPPKVVERTAFTDSFQGTHPGTGQTATYTANRITGSGSAYSVVYTRP